MKKLLGIMLLFAIGAVSSVQAVVFTAPAGTTISAAPAGDGSVTITWTTLSADQVVRFWLVEADPRNSAWTSAQNPPGKSAVLINVCKSNDKYPYDARFQLKASGRWLLITPKGVTNATLSGVHQECTRSTKGCALEVDESVLQQACSAVPQQ